MKVIVTSLGETMESPVDKRFGRARYLVLCDLETGKWTTHSNEQDNDSSRGTGVRESGKVVELGAEAVITGHCGSEALSILTAGGIDIYEGAAGTIKEAIDAFKAGKLKKSGKADAGAG